MENQKSREAALALASQVIELVQAYPGLPVTVVSDENGLGLGVLNLVLTDEDWFQRPVKLPEGLLDE